MREEQYRAWCRDLNIDVASITKRKFSDAFGNDPLELGRRRFAQMQSWMNDKLQCTPQQRQFHEAFLHASLPWIYTPEAFFQNQSEILGTEQVYRPYIVVSCPRRFGKTTAVSVFAAAALRFCAGVTVSVFSTGKRASSGLSEAVAKFLAPERFRKHNQEELFLQNGSKLFSYPSSTKGLKGVGGDIIILEEAGQLDTRVLKEVVAPLLMVEHTSLLAISTPVEDSTFSHLLDYRDASGVPLFKSFNIRLICSACEAAGAKDCPHMQHLVPPWKRNADRARIVDALMGGDVVMHHRENLGVDAGRETKIFLKEWLDALVNRARPQISPQPVYYVAIDPNGGGPSNLGVCCVCYVDSKLVVVLARAYPITEASHIASVVGKCLLAVPSGASVVTIVERNFGGTPLATMICRRVEDARPDGSVRHVGTGREGQLGVTTTAHNKECMRMLLETRLQDGQISLSSDVSDADASLLCQELRSFRYTERGALTGKNDRGMQDDRAMSLMLACFFSQQARAGRVNVYRPASGITAPHQAFLGTA